MPSERHIVLLPMNGAPRIMPAASSMSLRDQVEDLCGGHVSLVPAPEWKGDRFRLAIAVHPQVGTQSRVNALAGRVLGVPIHGPCVLARRAADDAEMFRAEEPGNRFLQPLDTSVARDVLSALGEEIESMHGDDDAK